MTEIDDNRQDVVLNPKPGEIYKELLALLLPHEKDIEKLRKEEEMATYKLIQKLQVRKTAKIKKAPKESVF